MMVEVGEWAKCAMVGREVKLRTSLGIARARVMSTVRRSALVVLVDNISGELTTGMVYA